LPSAPEGHTSVVISSTDLLECQPPPRSPHPPPESRMEADERVDELLGRACKGDPEARQHLLQLYRGRLRQMVAARRGRRVAVRVDPSDVVQEALIDANARLDEFLQLRPVPFSPWLRRIAWERLVKLHRLHAGAHKRSVGLEWSGGLPDESALDLVCRL